MVTAFGSAANTLQNTPQLRNRSRQLDPRQYPWSGRSCQHIHYSHEHFLLSPVCFPHILGLAPPNDLNNTLPTSNDLGIALSNLIITPFNALKGESTALSTPLSSRRRHWRPAGSYRSDLFYSLRTRRYCCRGQCTHRVVPILQTSMEDRRR